MSQITESDVNNNGLKGKNWQNFKLENFRKLKRKIKSNRWNHERRFNIILQLS